MFMYLRQDKKARYILRKANQAYNGPAARTFIKKMQFRKQIFDLLGNIIDELVGGITSEIIEGHGKCTAN